MKALVYTATRETRYRDEPDPQPNLGDALVQIEAVGICGSDMHAWHGQDSRRVPPLILGHEACGTVLTGTHSGKRVVLNPLIACGDCVYCTIGRSNLCARKEMIGMRVPGAFAQRIALPERNLIEMPQDMNAAHAALTEPCATAWHALVMGSRASWRPLPECDALVIGGGSVGLLSALILKHYGCASVRLAETNALRRKTAESAGIEAFDPAAELIADSTAHLVLDAVGSAATRTAGMQAVRPGGVVVHIGLQETGGDFDARKATLGEITFVGVYTYTEADLRASLKALYDGALGDLYWTEERALADGAEAFVDLDEGRSAAAKIILRP